MAGLVEQLGVPAYRRGGIATVQRWFDWLEPGVLELRSFRQLGPQRPSLGDECPELQPTSKRAIDPGLARYAARLIGKNPGLSPPVVCHRQP